MNIKKLRWQDIINPVKWWIFIKGTYLAWKHGVRNMSELEKFKNEVLTWDEPQEYKEQVIYRAMECEGCLTAGHCTHCGCTSPDNFLVRENWCSAGNWDQMLEKKYWEKFKEDYQI